MKTLFIVRNDLVKCRYENTVPHILSVPDAAQQYQIGFRPVRADLTLLKDVKSHHKEPYKMHRVLVQVIVILLVVPLADFIIFPDD